MSNEIRKVSALTRIRYIKRIISGALHGIETPGSVTIDSRFVEQFRADIAAGRKFKACAGGSDYIITEITKVEAA